MRKSQRKNFKESISLLCTLPSFLGRKAKRTLSMLALCPALVSMVSCSTDASSDESSNTDNKGEMGALECIMTRSSIRSWSEDKISHDTIETILKAAMASPTAVNRQPWTFVVVESDEARAILAEATNFGVPKRAEAKPSSRPERPNFVAQAPVTIVVCGNRDKFLDGVAADFWVEDTSAATENLLLAAHALGLGAVWCGVYPLEDRVESITKALDLPENLIPMCYVPMGYPDVEPNIKDKWDPQNVMWK